MCPQLSVCVEGIHSQSNWVLAQVLVKCWPSSFKADTAGADLGTVPRDDHILAFSSLRTQADVCTPPQSSSALQALGQCSGDGASKCWGWGGGREAAE